MSESRRYDIDQVRERTDLLAVVQQHVALRKMGGRFLGLCPFHQEKTPSFNVDPNRGFWHCFGCGKGGDAFTFVMELEHLSFMEAVEKLAERAGIRPTEEHFAPQRKEERDHLYEANAAGALAFRKALAGKAGGTAREYLARRGITPEIAERFELGYAPAGWDHLTKHLVGRGFAGPVLVKANLALAREGAGTIDRFRNRVMIPIHDRQGRVVAFGGRAMSPDDQPKYLNTAETPVFHKSKLLYLLHRAADPIVKKKRAIVTEGYFDAIACHIAGFEEAVASLGTALGEDHVQILRRLAERVYLVFDADSAGVNAALKSQALFRQAGVDVRIVRLPAGHDPDSLIREGGSDAFERCLNGSLTPATFELEQLVQQFPDRNADGRVRMFRAAARVLLPLPPIERAEYAAWLIDRWGGGGDTTSMQQALLSEVGQLERNERRTGRDSAAQPAQGAAPAPREDVFLEREVISAMVQGPAFAQHAVAELTLEAFTHPPYREVFRQFAALVAEGRSPDIRFIISDDEQVAATIAALAMREILEIRGESDRDRRFAAKIGGLGATKPEHALGRLKESQHLRTIAPRDVSLDDRAGLEAMMAAHRERSRQQKERLGY